MARSAKGKNGHNGKATFVNKLPSSHQQRQTKQVFKVRRERKKVMHRQLHSDKDPKQTLKVCCWNMDGINEENNTVINNILMQQKPDIFFGLETKEKYPPQQ